VRHPPLSCCSSKFRAWHAGGCSDRCGSRGAIIRQVSAGLAMSRWPPVSRSPGGRDMTKRLPILFLVAAASFAVIWLVPWFVLDAEKADATTSTIVPSKAVAPEPFRTAHAANSMTTRILALDQAKHLAFWTSVLKNKKQACSVVVRTKYQGRTESGVDSWSVGCRDGNKYSISIDPDAQGSEAEFPVSVCSGNAFARSAE
jgi:hypothetical protein